VQSVLFQNPNAIFDFELNATLSGNGFPFSQTIPFFQGLELNPKPQAQAYDVIESPSVVLQ